MAMLSPAEFDARTIVNGDEFLDLVCKVEADKLGPDKFRGGYPILTGRSYAGQEFTGEDEIIIVPPE